MRFVAELAHTNDATGEEAWAVIDTQHDRWSLPRKAVTLYMTAPSARAFVEILNDEWAEFLANPW